MKYIQLGIHLTDDLGIKAITIDHNESGLNSDSELIKRLSIAMLKGLVINKESVAIQDLLNEVNISLTSS